MQTRSSTETPPDYSNLNSNTKAGLYAILKELNIIPPENANREEIIRLIKLRTSSPRTSPYKSPKMVVRKADAPIEDDEDKLPKPEIDQDSDSSDSESSEEEDANEAEIVNNISSLVAESSDTELFSQPTRRVPVREEPPVVSYEQNTQPKEDFVPQNDEPEVLIHEREPSPPRYEENRHVSPVITQRIASPPPRNEEVTECDIKPLSEEEFRQLSPVISHKVQEERQMSPVKPLEGFDFNRTSSRLNVEKQSPTKQSFLFPQVSSPTNNVKQVKEKPKYKRVAADGNPVESNEMRVLLKLLALFVILFVGVSLIKMAFIIARVFSKTTEHDLASIAKEFRKDSSEFNADRSLFIKKWIKTITDYCDRHSSLAGFIILTVGLMIYLSMNVIKRIVKRGYIMITRENTCDSDDLVLEEAKGMLPRHIAIKMGIEAAEKGTMYPKDKMYSLTHKKNK